MSKKSVEPLPEHLKPFARMAYEQIRQWNIVRNKTLDGKARLHISIEQKKYLLRIASVLKSGGYSDDAFSAVSEMSGVSSSAIRSWAGNSKLTAELLTKEQQGELITLTQEIRQKYMETIPRGGERRTYDQEFKQKALRVDHLYVQKLDFLGRALFRKEFPIVANWSMQERRQNTPQGRIPASASQTDDSTNGIISSAAIATPFSGDIAIGSDHSSQNISPEKDPGSTPDSPLNRIFYAKVEELIALVQQCIALSRVPGDSNMSINEIMELLKANGAVGMKIPVREKDEGIVNL